ncbi:MAG: 2'-5' RNA ligase family protein [Chitinophagaceae bacterium]
MINNIRRQLTLFVEQNDAQIIEQVRQKFNPGQFDLIKAHVTLCRENEIENLDNVISNLLTLSQKAITIEFGKATRFDNGNGLLLTATGNNTEFHGLRQKVLKGVTDHPKKQEPHITLMHPRNSTCTDNIFKQVHTINLPVKLAFKKVSLIEQINGASWIVLQEFELLDRTNKL